MRTGFILLEQNLRCLGTKHFDKYCPHAIQQILSTHFLPTLWPTVQSLAAAGDDFQQLTVCVDIPSEGTHVLTVLPFLSVFHIIWLQLAV